MTPIPPSPDQLLTLAEAADEARLHQRTLRRAIHAGNLRAGQPRVGDARGGRIIIRRGDLWAWLYAEPAPTPGQAPAVPPALDASAFADIELRPRRRRRAA